VARIIGGIGTAHTPTIGFAHDRQSPTDPIWGPIFSAFAPIRAWLEEQKPDAIVIVYNDHVTSFFFDHYSAFVLGIGDRYEVADEGGGPRSLPAVAGHAALSQHIGQALMTEEFDMSFFQQRPLDHGVFSPLSMLASHEPGWTIPIVPLQIGVLQFPVPSALRCWKLGQALRRAIESYPEDLRVVVIGRGGLSHQVHGERAGFNNVPWDEQFMDLIERDPVAITEMTYAQLAERGGFEGAEVIMWLVMRGALSASVRRLHRAYYLPSMTGIGMVLFENEAAPPLPATVDAYRKQMEDQLRGAERLEGTYPFTFERSTKGYRLNAFLHDLVVPANRARFLADEEGAFEAARLTAEERDLVRRRDWRGLIHYGAIFFMLEKLGAVIGTSNLHIYAAMRGQSLEDFQQTRNAQVLYSVAGAERSATPNPVR
jgi:gallate dioxygenase